MLSSGSTTSASLTSGIQWKMKPYFQRLFFVFSSEEMQNMGLVLFTVPPESVPLRDRERKARTVALHGFVSSQKKLSVGFT